MKPRVLLVHPSPSLCTKLAMSLRLAGFESEYTCTEVLEEKIHRSVAGGRNAMIDFLIFDLDHPLESLAELSKRNGRHPEVVRHQNILKVLGRNVPTVMVSMHMGTLSDFGIGDPAPGFIRYASLANLDVVNFGHDMMRQYREMVPNPEEQKQVRLVAS